MRDSGGFETVDDDDFDRVLVEDEVGVEGRVPTTVSFDFALSDAGSATEFGRAATEMGYEVELRGPDDGEGYFEVICTRALAAGPVDVSRAHRELEALAEELGCLGDDDEHEAPETP